MNVTQLLGYNAKRFRLALGLTQGEVADAVGVSLQTIFSYESGSNWPRAETLAALCKVLKVRPWQMLAEEGGPTEPTVDEALSVLAREHGFKLVKEG